jgi:hypothetical protein
MSTSTPSGMGVSAVRCALRSATWAGWCPLCRPYPPCACGSAGSTAGSPTRSGWT